MSALKKSNSKAAGLGGPNSGQSVISPLSEGYPDFDGEADPQLD